MSLGVFVSWDLQCTYIILGENVLTDFLSKAFCAISAPLCHNEFS